MLGRRTISVRAKLQTVRFLLNGNKPLKLTLQIVEGPKHLMDKVLAVILSDEETEELRRVITHKLPE